MGNCLPPTPARVFVGQPGGCLVPRGPNQIRICPLGAGSRPIRSSSTEVHVELQGPKPSAVRNPPVAGTAALVDPKGLSYPSRGRAAPSAPRRACVKGRMDQRPDPRDRTGGETRHLHHFLPRARPSVLHVDLDGHAAPARPFAVQALGPEGNGGQELRETYVCTDPHRQTPGSQPIHQQQAKAGGTLHKAAGGETVTAHMARYPVGSHPSSDTEPSTSKGPEQRTRTDIGWAPV